MEEDLRVGVAVELLEHRVGERAVHRAGSRPRQAMRNDGSMSGADGEPPEVVLDEPERAVGDDVVVAVVRELVVRDEAQPVRRRRCGVSSIGSSPRSRGDDAVLVAHRARDPRHVVVGDQPAQRRDEPAAAAPHGALAVASRPKKSGPRFETTISLRRSLMARKLSRRRRSREGSRRCRLFGQQRRDAAAASRGPPRRPAATSVKRVEPGADTSSSRPPISVASSRAIARPRPLPEATERSSR